MVSDSFSFYLMIELASLEDCLQLSRRSDEVSSSQIPQRNTRSINISGSYASLLSRSTRDAKALEVSLESIDIQLRDVEVFLHSKHDLLTTLVLFNLAQSYNYWEKQLS